MSRDKDQVADAIRKALRAAEAAQHEALGDVRTSSTVCTDHIEAAVRSLQAAAQWMAEYQQEQQAAERPVKAVKPKAAPKAECHVCGEEIAADDVAVCGGCDQQTCSNCMGDDGICVECEKEGQ